MPVTAAQQEEFLALMLPYAQGAQEKTKAETIMPAGELLVGTALTHWALETGWGTSSLFRAGHNLAGVRSGRNFATYTSVAQGMMRYTDVLELPIYRDVLTQRTVEAQLQELGQSPWDLAHYGNPPGSELLAVWRENVQTWLAKLAPEAPAVQQQAQRTGWKLLAQIPGRLVGEGNDVSLVVAIPFLDAEGHEVPIDCTVDSGAQRTLFGSNVPGQVSLAAAQPADFAGVDGAVIHGQKGQARFTLGGRQWTCEAWDARHAVLTGSLFGANWFKANGLEEEIDWRDAVLNIYEPEV